MVVLIALLSLQLHCPLSTPERLAMHCMVPENIQASPTEGILSWIPLEIRIKFHTYLYTVWSWKTSHPPGNSNTSVEGVYTFYETAHYITFDTSSF